MMAVTPASFKAAKPQFATVPDATVQGYLDLAARQVDASWLPADRDPATIAYTCHLMTLDGLGTGAEAKKWARGTAEYRSVKSGNLTLTRFESEAEGAGYSDWLRSTSCGKLFWWYLRANRSGPRLVTGGVGVAVTGYAKDWPRM